MISAPVLIGIGGLLASGKDTVADHLVEQHGFIKMGMSEPLNDALLALNPWIDDPTYAFIRYQQLHAEVGYTQAKENPEVRRLLQTLGTEVGRDMIDPEVWTKIAERRILFHMAAGRSVILTGIRFPNERDMIKRIDGTLIWVERQYTSLVTPGGSPAGTHSTKHASENTLSADDFNMVLDNDSTLDALYSITDSALEIIRGLNDGTATLPWITGLNGVSQVIAATTWPSYDH